MKKFSLYILSIFLLGTTACNKSKKVANVPTNFINQDSIAKIRKEIRLEQKAAQIKAIFDRKAQYGMSGSVLVAQRGQIIFEKSYGFADREDSTLNTADTKFQLASLSKTFTAIATLKLIEEGKISFENTLQDFFPELPFEGVTVRSMLSHRSGLPYYQYTFDKKVRGEKLYPSNHDIIKWFGETKPPYKMWFKPDHRFAYNNTNFVMLAGIVEKVTGMSFDQYLQNELFKKLDMHNTFSIDATNDSLNLKRAYGYQWNRKLERDHYDYTSGDKGIYSSTHDLFKWYQALKTNKILSTYMLQEAYTPRSFENQGLRNYGYGFRLWVNSKQQTEYVYHTGWWKGFNTIMFFDPREDFVIIVLSNVYNRNIYDLKPIINILHVGNKSNFNEENVLDV